MRRFSRLPLRRLRNAAHKPQLPRVRRRARLEQLEPRQLLAAEPFATLDAPPETFLGEPVSFEVTFTNQSLTDAGYGPYIDLLLPATGADGAGPAVDDGITFSSASYLGQSVAATVLTFDEMGSAAHPFARDSSGSPVVVTGTPGDQLVVLPLPFGSFTPGQPDAVLTVTALVSPLADVAVSLTVQARGGFRFGNDPLDNPDSDPSLVEPIWHTTTITPTVWRITKTYHGPENETATGPNYPRQYTISVDIADGVTLTELVLRDVLPDSLQFVAVESTLVHGAPVTTDATATPDLSTPGGLLARRFADVTGTAAADDASLTFTFYVPDTDAAGHPVLDAQTGDDSTADNHAGSSAAWTPADDRDDPTVIVLDPPGPEHSLTVKSLAIQKSSTIVVDTGAPGLSPGDTLEYQLAFQISDYFSFGDLVATDILSDGQQLDAAFTPVLSVNGRHGTFTGPFTTTGSTPDLIVDLSQIGNDTDPATDGSTQLVFDISQALINAGAPDGVLQGGRAVTPDAGPAQGTITFRAVVQEHFSDTYLPNTPNVSAGDVLHNRVTLSGSVRDNLSPATVLGEEEDDSASSRQIAMGTLVKSIYAVNSDTDLSSPVEAAPGDTVTYRFTYHLPLTDFDGLSFVDYLPLPIFDATTLTSFDPTVSAAVPPAGTFKHGPSDTFRARTGLTPTFTTSSTSNSFTITYLDFDDPTSSPSTLDLLATFVVSADPYADQLLLTNQVRVNQLTTNADDLVIEGLVQLVLTEPVLQVTKGAVAADNSHALFSPTTVGPAAFSAPGSANPRFSGTINSSNLAAQPIVSNVTQVDAADRVTFAIVVENIGTGLHGAFDVRVRDTMPSGFAVPAGGLNLSVTDGAGNPLTYVDLGGGLFGAGLELVDGPGTGALSAYDPADGRNIVVITYDLEATTLVTAGSIQRNTATLFHYAGVEGGPDFAPTDLTGTATTTIAPPAVTKSVGASEAVIGDVITFQVVVTVPEGSTPDLRVTDTLDGGLAFVDLVDITTSDPAHVSWTSPVSPVVTDSGGTVAFAFGDVLNSDTDNDDPQTITLTYRAVVLNVLTNQQGTRLGNSAEVSWSLGALPPVSSAPVTVVEPDVTTTKTVTVGAGGSTGDAGDAVQYVVTLRNSSGVDAYDLTFSDVLPWRTDAGALIRSPSFSVTDTAGLVTAADFELVGDDASGWTVRTASGVTFDMPSLSGRTISITITGSLGPGVRPAETIANTAETRFTSIDGDPGVISPYHPQSTERTGEDGFGADLNNYVSQGNAQLNIYPPNPVKSIATSSEASTSGSAVTIGEIVRYRVTARLAEGTAPSFQIVDALPSGLRMLDDGTAKVAFVSNQAGITSSTLSGTGLSVSGNETTLASITPTFVLPAGAITGQPFQSGTDPVFNLGTLVNADRDADLEYVVLEFNALVENIADNQAGVTRNNTARVHVAGAAAGPTSNTLGVSLVEPSLSFQAKTANPLSGDAGDIITYRVTYANSAAANVTTAFDVRLVDALPPGLALDLGSVTITVDGGTGAVNHSTGNTVEIVLASLAPGGTVQVDYQATLTTGVQPEELITNTAQITYSSLPDNGTAPNLTGSTVPGAAGSATGERDGQGGVNRYAAEATATVTVASPEFSKIVLSTNQSFTTGADVAIGELVTYELRFSVVEGTTLDVRVFDQFPTGMALVSLDSIVASPALSSSAPGGFAGGLAAADVHNEGQTFTIHLHDITNTDTDNATIETVRITFTAVVLNIPANQDGGNLVNAATVFYSSGDATTVAPTVHVVEPQLAVTKVPSATHSDAGGAPVTFTITIAHDGDSSTDAFDIVVQDVIPPGFDYVYDSLSFIDGVVPDALSESLGVISAAYSSLPLGASSRFSFAVALNDTTTPGDTVTNTAAARYSSLPGDVTTPLSPYHPGSVERTGDASGPGGLANDLFVTADGAVTVWSNTLSGFVFVDRANDGVRDPGDPGIPDVTVTLVGTDNLGFPVNLDAVTAGDGGYTFTGLRPGDYRIVETQPAGYLDGIDSVGTQGGTAGDDWIDVLLPAGGATVGTENNFGELQPARVSGLVFDDRNNNGLADPGEAGIAHVAAYLTGIDDRGHTVELTVTTDLFGVFQFDSLRPGTYTLAVPQPAGWLDGQDTVGLQGGTLGDDMILDFTLAPGDEGTGNLFGELQPASISGTVYEDLNNNGAHDPGEAGIGDVLVTLRGTDDRGQSVDREVTTSADGQFLFADLRPGVYELVETQPVTPFYFDGLDTAGSLGGLVLDDQITSIAVAPGDAAVEYLFGELPPADPTGYVFVDVNNNGHRDPGEPPIPGVVVTVTGIDDLGQSVTLATTTDDRGFYQFAYLRPGTYRITETQPAGYIDGQEENGVPPAIVGDDYFDGLTLTWGQMAGDYNFGELAFGSLAGRVYVDTNQNGLRDSWEPGIANVIMTLTGEDIVGNPLAPRTTLTDAAGDYVFDNLPPGTYRIAETQPAGYLDGLDHVGSLGGTLQPDAVDEIFLQINDTGIGYDFGENGPLPGSITKQYFLARNRRV